jgi:hypothetical protein
VSGRRTTKLDYGFTPTPRWLLADVASGLITAETYTLLAFLYQRSDTARLAARLPTPTLRLDTIAEAIRWSGKPESLRRRLARMRDLGRYFTYVVDGNSQTTQRYVFMLLPDEPDSAAERRLPVHCEVDPPGERPVEPEAAPDPGPPVHCEVDPPGERPVEPQAASDRRPPGHCEVCPPGDSLEGPSESRLDRGGAHDLSVRSQRAEQGSRPPVAPPRPPAPDGATPHHDMVGGPAENESCPPASDVQERTNSSSTERHKGEESEGDVARARQSDDRFLAALNEQTKQPQSDLPELIERARLAALAAERRAARERTLRLADELPDDERNFLVELVETLEAVIVDDHEPPGAGVRDGFGGGTS